MLSDVVLLSDQSMATLVELILFGTVAGFWWTGKRLAVIWERPIWWDATDLWAAALAGVLMGISKMATTSFSISAAAAPPKYLLALRYGAMAAYATWLSGWFLSIYLETETEISTPTDLDPVPERARRIQLGWVSFTQKERDDR